ncbi:ATP-binding protein [Anaeroselena agilis]|uniref:ATP-binding protein n=1 Tax=Anaeroselena agilis TaxID=3063788 RepID=A0ABU3NT27_9FIRM|nr:ATP-binding protein [Selenomonadales bacterium 4137-cl]
MKELVIMSGKGGTGKTSISAALAYLAPEKVLADCDVDAANLHLMVGARQRESHGFVAGFEPEVNVTECVKCGRCTALCRFKAIDNGAITSPFACEGCGVCAFNCPAHAISMRDKSAGRWLVSDTRFGTMVHAELGLAVENSGKLVSRVRLETKKLAEKQKVPLIITDGPPGIGCPAIATVTGADLVLAVVEPSLSAMHDLERLRNLCGHFKVPIAVCINKATLSPANTGALKESLAANDVPVVGEIAYDSVFRTAVQTSRTVMEIDNIKVQEKILELWYNLSALLGVTHNESVVHKLDRKLKSFAGWV